MLPTKSILALTCHLSASTMFVVRRRHLTNCSRRGALHMTLLAMATPTPTSINFQRQRPPSFLKPVPDHELVHRKFRGDCTSFSVPRKSESKHVKTYSGGVGVPLATPDLGLIGDNTNTYTRNAIQYFPTQLTVEDDQICLTHRDQLFSRSWVDGNGVIEVLFACSHFDCDRKTL